MNINDLDVSEKVSEKLSDEYKQIMKDSLQENYEKYINSLIKFGL